MTSAKEATRRGSARVFGQWKVHVCGSLHAGTQRIPSETRLTTANGLMMSYSTNGIKATGIGTRIMTLHVDAGLAAGTIAVLHAFRSTINVGVPKVILDAAA